MDWTKIKRKPASETKPAGPYTNLEALVRIQFRARDFSFLPTQPVNSILSGRYASRLRGRGLNFEELRRYQSGDDIRTMDWKVTARTRIPHVRVYTEEKDRAVLLVVDQRLNMFFGTKDRFKSVTAAELAALGAWRSTKVGDRVGAIVFNDQVLHEIRPQRSQQNTMSILNSIVQTNHELQADSEIPPNPGMLNQALEKAHHLAPHDALVIVISDFAGADEHTERLVARITAHNDIIGILVHDPVRLQPPSQSLTISDGSLQAEINFDSRQARDKVLNDYQEEQEHLTTILRRLSAPLLMVSNEGDVVDQVRRLLGVPFLTK
jgi:uncharacterized protein (DUF58 family)